MQAGWYQGVLAAEEEEEEEEEAARAAEAQQRRHQQRRPELSAVRCPIANASNGDDCFAVYGTASHRDAPTGGVRVPQGAPEAALSGVEAGSSPLSRGSVVIRLVRSPYGATG